MIDPPTFERLKARLGPDHMARRIAREHQHEDEIAGSRWQFLHRDNWFAHPHIIRTALCLTGLYWQGKRNAAAVELRRNRIRFSGLPEAFDGFTILQLSDLHTDGSEPAMDRVLALLDGIQYDICCLTGDYRAGTAGSCEPALYGMRKLLDRLKSPVFAILGNHDSIRMVAGLEDMGVRLLLNEAAPLLRGSDTIHLAGVDDAHYFETCDIGRAASQIPAGGFSLLLSHTPEVYAEAAAAGFRLMLSGHTHGGQICLPGSIPLILDAVLPRGYGAGPWQHAGMHGYTSVGAGTSIVPVRFNCPPEITLHTLLTAQ